MKKDPENLALIAATLLPQTEPGPIKSRFNQALNLAHSLLELATPKAPPEPDAIPFELALARFVVAFRQPTEITASDLFSLIRLELPNTIASPRSLGKALTNSQKGPFSTVQHSAMVAGYRRYLLDPEGARAALAILNPQKP